MGKTVEDTGREAKETDGRDVTQARKAHAGIERRTKQNLDNHLKPSLYVLARGKPQSLAAVAPGVERTTRKARRRRGAIISSPCLCCRGRLLLLLLLLLPGLLETAMVCVCVCMSSDIAPRRPRNGRQGRSSSGLRLLLLLLLDTDESPSKADACTGVRKVGRGREAVMVVMCLEY